MTREQSIETEVVAETHRRLKRRLRFRLPRLTVEFTDHLHQDWDCIYRRNGRSFVLELPAHSAKFTCSKAGELGSTYLYWLTQCPADVEQLGVTLSDGDSPTAVRFSPSTNQPGVIPIPDPFFLGNRGFESWGYFARSQCLPWHDRSDQIVWRGSASGVGNFDPADAMAQPEQTAHRLRFCLVARGRTDLDVGLHRYLGEGIILDRLREQGIVKDTIPEQSWVGRKFAIDIDGQTNTWSNFLIRMHLGCCIFKIDSPCGFRQWYYERLRPFEHFIPVKSDFSDLFDKIEWARQNDARCAEIAENAQAFARSLTFKAGRREAVDLISRHWR